MEHSKNWNVDLVDDRIVSLGVIDYPCRDPSKMAQNEPIQAYASMCLAHAGYRPEKEGLDQDQLVSVAKLGAVEAIASRP